MNKHIVVIVLALSIALALTACSQSPQTKPGEQAAWSNLEPVPGLEAWDGNSPLFYVWWDGTGWRGRLIGEIKDEQIRGFDSAGVYIDGKPLNDEIRNALPHHADGSPAYKTETAYAALGQAFQLYDATNGRYAGNCKLTSMQYSFEGSSGSDVLEGKFAFVDASLDSAYFAIAGTLDMRPREVAEAGVEGGYGQYYVLTADVDNDGAEETISWDMSTPDGQEEHTIFVLRGSTRLSTVRFWYDYDFSRPEEFAYTVPLNPSLLDINGDGAYELVLQAKGHNSYVRVYAWENDEYKYTGAGYYSGD